MLLSDRSVAVTVRELADGTVTAEQLAAACAWGNRDAALAAARDADERRAGGSPLPLLGLPVAVDPTVRDAAAARAAGAVVLGTVRDAATALADGVPAVLGRQNAATASWRPAGARTAVLARHAADLPLLGPLLGVTTPQAHGLDGIRIGARGTADTVVEAATRLSLAGFRVADVDRRLTGRVARAQGADPLAGADVLIGDGRLRVPPTHACVRVAGVVLAAPRACEHVVLALAALLDRDE